MPKIEMNLVDYMRVLRKRKRVFILTIILVFVSVTYYTLKQTPIYSASSKVKIEQRKSVAAILTEMITWSPGDEMASQATIIKSFNVLRRVAEKENLMNSNMDEMEENNLIRGLQSQIETERIGFTNIIMITVTSDDPQQAMRLANLVADEYRDWHFENKKQEASQVKIFVGEQLNSYYQELLSSEKALTIFQQQNPFITAAENLKAGQEDPRITSLLGEITKLELEHITLKSRYTDIWPDVIAKKQNLDNAKQKLSDLQSQLAVQNTDNSVKEIELLQLERSRSVAEELYVVLKKKYEEANILEAEKVHNVEKIEPAALPSSPIRPNRRLNMMLGLVGGVLFGFLVIFVSESFDTTIGRIEDIEEVLNVSVLGIIPSVTLGKKSSIFDRFNKKETQEKDYRHLQLPTLFKPTSVASEAYRVLRTHLDYIGAQNGGKCITITSSAPKEGKSQTVSNLGLAFAQSGVQTLIVGADFRKPSLYKIFGIDKKPGLSEILIKSVSWRDAVKTETDILMGELEYDQVLKIQGIENLSIITSGTQPPNPAEMLNFPEMEEFVKDIKQEFDVVLFDTPPVLPVSDPTILGPITDGVIIIYQAGATSRYALSRAKQQIEGTGSKIFGVVINNIKAEYIEDITPYQKYRYYGYYGEKKKKG